MKTALSVHAKEFYPRVAGGAGASGCSPSGWVEEEEDEEEGGGGGGGGSAEAALHDFVRDFVSSLSVRPALYEAESPLFLDTLTACVSSEHSLLIVLHGIYEQALAESNFTYTAARLCNLLSQKLVVNSHAGTFRQHLLKRCHVEYESRELVAQGDAASRKRLHAYSIFLTELYLHLEVLSGSQRTRAAILRAGVKDVIHTLLAHPSDDNVTCSIKMLKLCGSVLEDDFRLEGKSSMDELMERMKSVVLDGSCERPVRSMLLKLIELRSSNWGRVTPTSTPTPTHCPLTDPDYYMNEPVFYTADGTPFTAADPEFREHYERVMQHEAELRKRFPRAARTATESPDHYYVDSDSDSGEGDGAEEDDDENGEGDGDAGMDPEMQAAFEIFCQEAEKKKTKAK